MGIQMNSGRMVLQMKSGYRKQKDLFWIIVFLLPNTLLYFMYTILPAIMTAWFSFLDWNGFQVSGKFCGLKNYIDLFQDPVFFQSLKATFLFMLFVIPLRFGISLGFGLLLNSRRCRFKSFFRTLLFLPVVTTGAIIGTIMIMIFDPSHGPVNIVLEKLGLLATGKNLLGSYNTALYAAGSIWTWKWMGMSLIYWIASLQSIPDELYEAATIDGASAFQTFRCITAPLLKSFAIIILILTVSDSLRVFDLMLTLTNGGPFYSTETIELFIYHTAFTDRVPRLGYASSAATIFALIFCLITMLQSLTKRKNRGV
jgi:multiple sugar transport system permease protein